MRKFKKADKNTKRPETGLARKVTVIALIATMFPLASFADQWPLKTVFGPGFSHRNSLLLLMNKGETWKSLFVDRFNEVGTSDRFGAPRMMEEQKGLVGTHVNLVAPPSGSDGISFGYGLSFFINNLANSNNCIFEVGSCLRKFISWSADNTSLYNRCTIDAYDELAKLHFDNGIAVNQMMGSFRPAYTEFENEIQDINAKIEKNRNDGRQSEVKDLMAQRKELQARLQNLADRAWNYRMPLAAELVQKYKKMNPDSHDQGCEKINRLLAVSLLDADLFNKEGLMDVVFQQMRQQGLIFEFSAQLAIYTKSIEDKLGKAAVLRSSEIRELRREQIELYANYSLLRAHTMTESDLTSSLNPTGFLRLVDLSNDNSYKTTATLDEELLFLLESFHRDYPGLNATFTLRDGRQLSENELAQLLVTKEAQYERIVQKGNQWIIDHENCNSDLGRDSSGRCRHLD